METHEDNLKAEYKEQQSLQQSDLPRVKLEMAEFAFLGFFSATPFIWLWQWAIGFEAGLGNYEPDYSPVVALVIAAITTSVVASVLFTIILRKSTQTQKQRELSAERNIANFAIVVAVLATIPHLYPVVISTVSILRIRIGFGTYIYILSGLIVIGCVPAIFMYFVTRWIGMRYLKRVDEYWGIEARKQKQD